MLGKYKGPVILREEPVRPARVPGNYPRKVYPRWRNKYGVLIADHKVTLEQELQEIRTRHEAHREYHRARYQGRKARQTTGTLAYVSVSHCEVDEPDSR